MRTPFLLSLVAASAAQAPTFVAETISSTGTTCLWIAFAGLFLPTLYFLYNTFQVADGKRYFHIVTMLICAIASLAYLTMASGSGFIIRADGRQFFYARYIDWALTTPLQLLDLCGLAGASADTTLFLMATDFLMIVSGAVGALLNTYPNKWFFWCFGMFFFMPILYFLTLGLNDKADQTGAAAAAVFKKVALLTAVSWSAYPAVWVFGEGAGLISADNECIAYTLLDITAKSVFGFLIISARDGIEEALAADESKAALTGGGGYQSSDVVPSE
jgi:bacteriorhodopsin